EAASRDFCIESLQLLVLERKRPRQHCKQDHAQTPDIHFWPRVSCALNNLGRRIERRAAVGLQMASWMGQIRKPKIDQLDLASVVNDVVHGPSLPVHAAVSDEVLDWLGVLRKASPCMGLGVREYLAAAIPEKQACRRYTPHADNDGMVVPRSAVQSQIPMM